MSCQWCQSYNQSTFLTEMSIHLPVSSNLREPPVLAFPHIVICLDCGFAQFRIEGAELARLVEERDEREIAS
jgi:hypothetical protein